MYQVKLEIASKQINYNLSKEALFGDNFKKYRKRKGISQKEFADLLYKVTGKKLTLTSVSNYETGIHMPPPQILPTIAEILEVSIDALFGKEETTTETAPLPEAAAMEAVKEWKQELEKLERAFIYWKAANETTAGKDTIQLSEFCESLIELSRKQQEELMVLQTEVSTIRDLLMIFKGKF